MSTNGYEFSDDTAVALAEEIEPAIRRLAAAITPNICGSHDAAGGHVESLTEAVMGVTNALTQIAGALESIADAIKERGE